MLITYFLIKNLPLYEDLTKYINYLILINNKRVIEITNDIYNDNILKYECIDSSHTIIGIPFANIYIKQSMLCSIMVYTNNGCSRLNYKKSFIEPKFLKLTNEIGCFYRDKYRLKKVTLNNLSDCKQGYYRCFLPLSLTYEIF